MEKIVKEPLKIDFHIHSYFSRYKDDYKLVKNGTIENIPTLIDKLNEHKINMISITDHDFFSYDIYKALKQHEGERSLKKVFPGVEFSVGFKDENGLEKPVHVICIFDDENEEKVSRIASCIPFDNECIDYGERKEYFTEEKFISILRSIDLNVITIAHQKSSVSSSTHYKNDAKSLGEVKFNELITCEYFESFEFKNMKNGMFNNLFAGEINKKYDLVRFITGSDCHDWSYYPKHDSKENVDNFKFTFLKCLPSFRGLAMAFSDTNRISTNDFIFSFSNKKLKEIELNIAGNNYTIPLSEGINAIIGDNSIGKSLLLHKLTGYKYLNNIQTKEGYESYLKRNNITVVTQIDDNLLHSFDYQSSIRMRFESGTQDNSNFLSDKFPEELDKTPFLKIISEQLDNYFDAINTKLEYDKTICKLNNPVMVDVEIESKNISCTAIKNNKNKIKDSNRKQKFYSNILNAIDSGYETILKDEEEKEYIRNLKIYLDEKHKQYSQIEKSEQLIYDKKSLFNDAIKQYKDDVSSYRSNVENQKCTFDNESSIALAETIADLVELKRKITKYEFPDDVIEIEPSRSVYGSYIFVRKFANCRFINKTYFESLITRSLKQGKSISTDSVTLNKLMDAIRDTRGRKEDNPLVILKDKIKDLIVEDFKSVPAITKEDQDIYSKLSSGMNASIYFEILATDKREGIYIVDQPEDDVSQSSIKNSIIREFKSMSQNRQIILITHNPQFVVNLDVDNVIIIRKNNGSIDITSGALEYKDDKTDILELVASNLDGGIESIRKRWKRYDKTVNT